MQRWELTGFAVGTLTLFAATSALPKGQGSQPDMQSKGLGVCSFTTQNRRCWNMEGNPDPEVDRLVDHMVRRGTEIKLHFGGSNLFALVKSNFQVAEIRQADQAPPLDRAITDQQFPDRWDLVPIVLPAQSLAPRWAMLRALSYGQSWSAETRFVLQGSPSAATYSDRFTFKSYKPFNRDPNQEFAYTNFDLNVGDRTYLVDVAPGKISQGPYLRSPQMRAYSPKGEPIEFVDRQGKTIDAATFISNRPPHLATSSDLTVGQEDERNYSYLHARFERISDAANGDMRFETNVSPADVASLGLSTAPYIKYIGAFPLQPNSATPLPG